jgi:hypothetical protein
VKTYETVFCALLDYKPCTSNTSWQMLMADGATDSAIEN